MTSCPSKSLAGQQLTLGSNCCTPWFSVSGLLRKDMNKDHVSSLCWLLLLLCRSFWVWHGPASLLLFLLPVHLVSYPWGHCQTKVMELSPVLSSRNFIVSGITFKSLIHLQLTFGWHGVKGSISFFCIWISSFPSTIRWRDSPYPLALPEQRLSFWLS